MKKVLLLAFSLSLLLSACSNQSTYDVIQEQEDFNTQEYNENFELEFEEVNLNKIEIQTEIQKDTNVKKFAEFKDEKIWFSFLYPDNEKIIKDINTNPIKIQNYELWQKFLNIWDFDIEILYLQEDIDCENEISEITSVYQNKWVMITRWLWKQEWDNWWTKYAMCFHRSWQSVYISYIENWSLYVNTIFNSLQIQ